MAFIMKQGYWRSENGWRMVDAAECEWVTIPGSTVKIQVRKGAPAVILPALAARLNKEVEPVRDADTGCYTGSNSMPSSNHNSATAMDYNWNLHPFHVWGTWKNRPAFDNVINSFGGIIESGANWTSPRDEMHQELHFPEGHAGTEALARDLLNGKWGIYKPGPAPIPPPPLTPVPTQGDPFLLEIGSTGDLVRKLQHGLNVVFPRYRNTPLDEDGDYGPMTAGAVSEFQSRAGGLVVDGDVGPKTRAKLAEYGVKL